MTLIRLAVAWLCGMALTARLGPPTGLLLAASALLIGALLLWYSSDRARQPLALLICALLGAARAQIAVAPPGPDHIARQNGQGVVTFRGLIVAEPDRRDRRTDYRVSVAARQLDGSWHAARGLVLVSAPAFPLHAYGDTVVVTGRLEAPPVLERFDYRAYLARKGIHSLTRRPRVETVATSGGQPLRRALLALKLRARRALAASLPEPEASLATGIILGDARGIPRRVDEAFRVTNTTHVIAISGANISILVMALTAVLGRLLGRRRCVPVVLLAVGLYTALVGADAAVVRAAVMGSLVAVGVYLGRPGHTATLLMAAAWAMTAYRPEYLWDLGFQLSFAATLGLVLFTRRIGSGFEAVLARRMATDRAGAVVRLLHEAVIVTLAAQLTTWPLIAYHVGQVSLAGLVANLLILPAQPPLMALGALTSMAGMAWPPAGRLVGVVAWLPLVYTIRTVELVARLPLASVDWQMPGPLLVAYYLGVGLSARPGRTLTSVRRLRGVLLRRLRRTPVRWSMWNSAVTGRLARREQFALVILAVVCPLVWVRALSRPDGLLHVHALDVGQGDAVLVVTPNGRRMLVDGGPSPSAVLAGLGRRLAPWDRRLDVVVLTHPDADHVGGLPVVIERYQVGVIVDPRLDSATADAAAWRSAVAQKGTPVVTAVAGGRIVLDEAAGVTVDVLWPPETRMRGSDAVLNDNSVVLRLVYGMTAVLLTGDIGEPAETELVRRGEQLRADVLKVAHHGSSAGTTSGFLAAVRPAVAVIGVGADNTFGHPSAAVLERLGAVHVWRTDFDGAVEVLLDGRNVWVR